MTSKGLPNFAALKDRVIQQVLERRLRQAEQADAGEPIITPLLKAGGNDIPEKYYRFHLHPGYQKLRILTEGAERIGVPSPFFKVHDGLAGATTVIGNREYINFSSYNYLGLSGHPDVVQAAKDAIDRYGTSVSASRMVAGERPVHQDLEKAIADSYGTDDAVAFVSGHATNVTIIGCLFGPKDLVIHDDLIHNSVLQGIQLSGACRLPFPHNNWAALDNILTNQRRSFERVLVALEGIYSMDGDYPDLPRFIELKRKHRVFLMVDEAHSFGVMGKTGMGIREHFDLRSEDVDIWMGTLSKALAGCGGFVTGESALVEHLKFLAPGFLYSVGMPPSLAAASRAALQCLRREPERVAAMQKNGQIFLKEAKSAGINTGMSSGLAVIPAIVGNSIKAAKLSTFLFARGINVQPILHPAVPEKSARLRFFVSSQHTEDQIRETIQVVRDGIRFLQI